MLTINALNAADSFLVPLQCEYFALEGLSQLMHTVSLIRQSINPALVEEGIVLTMFDGRNNLANEVVKEVRKHFHDKVFETVVPGMFVSVSAQALANRSFCTTSTPKDAWPI